MHRTIYSMKNRKKSLMAALLLTNITPLWAAGDMAMDHSGHTGNMSTPTADAAEMDFSGMDMESESAMDHSAMGHSMGDDAAGGTMQHGAGGMGGMKMQGGSAPADARDPHAYSDGLEFRASPRLTLADQYTMATLMVDRLEAVRGKEGSWRLYDLKAMYGSDYNRIVLKSEGEIANDSLMESSTQLLWSHAIDTYWNSELGLRYDSGEGENQSWLAMGVQGLAPYWFEVGASAYLGDGGRSAVGLSAEYELLFTQKLILQPRVETTLYGKDDPERGLGSGLSSVTAGLRLRYEVRREFAPYIGIEWAGTYGDTADYVRAAGGQTDDTRVVAGLRFWF